MKTSTPFKIFIIKNKYENFEIIIDSEDYEKISGFKWYLKDRNSKNKFYFVYWKKGHTTALHKFLVGVDNKDVRVKHINGNTLDNRKCNLVIEPFSALKQFKNETGKVYGYLTVLSYSHTQKAGAYWNCLCRCGTNVKISGPRLRNGWTTSCGCYNREVSRKAALEPGLAAFRALYSGYKHGAKKRNLEFNLTQEQFKQLTSSNCYYCNVEPKQISKRKTITTTYIYNGVDRINNNLGYTIENLVSCCGLCNQMKMNETREVFLNKIKQIYENLKFTALSNILSGVSSTERGK